FLWGSRIRIPTSRKKRETWGTRRFSTVRGCASPPSCLQSPATNWVYADVRNDELGPWPTAVDLGKIVARGGCLGRLLVALWTRSRGDVRERLLHRCRFLLCCPRMADGKSGSVGGNQASRTASCDQDHDNSFGYRV